MRSLAMACLLGLTMSVSGAAQGYVPNRVYDARDKRWIEFEVLTARAASSDIVFFGEEHDSRDTHRLELALLAGIRRRRPQATVALEMFERDAATPLAEYFAGTRAEEEFLKEARPWPRYLDDYRPLVEFARAHGWTVVASNVPRRLASLVSKESLAGLDTLDASERGLIAAELHCEPKGEYYDRFAAEMATMPTHGTTDTTAAGRAAQLRRTYQAQCLKDETMAESVAKAWSPGGLVVHFNGSFHTDRRLGTAERLGRRLPDTKRLVITAVPVANLDTVDPSKDDRKRGDILLFVLAPKDSTESVHR
jgi:uncharacterized iron-regulated protein